MDEQNQGQTTEDIASEVSQETSGDDKKQCGSIAGAIIIIIIIIVGGLYFWGSQKATAPTDEVNTDPVADEIFTDPVAETTPVNETDSPIMEDPMFEEQSEQE